MFIDSHCHIDFPDLAVREDELIANMRAQQVSHALCVSVNIEQWPRVTAMAGRHDNVFASLGVHPDYEDVTEPDVAQLVKLSDHPRVVAIGETGLDYFRLTGDLAWQRARFRTHIRAARECGKPLIIHTRSAAEDTLAIMREEKAHEVGGVMHCFTESLEVAEAAIDMGFLHFLFRHRHIQERAVAARCGQGHSGARHADRNRFALPCAGALPRQDERAVLRAACGGRAGARARHVAR